MSRTLIQTFRITLLGMTLVIGSSVHSGDKPLGLDAVPVCYNFGCKVKEVVALSPSEWAEVSGWFKPQAETAEEERHRLRQALGWMEVVIGNHTPTHRDLGQNLSEGAEFPGQLDCVDESLNTTTYLTLFEQQGLLKWHRVLPRAYRRSLFDQHWSGQVEDIQSGEHYVFDSWFQDNGYLPYLQTTSEWQKIRFFYSSYVDNAPE